MANNSFTEKTKGFIECPNGCGEKDLVFEGTSGRVSHKCPKCGRFAVFDYDAMEAYPSKPVRGAVHNLKITQ